MRTHPLTALAMTMGLLTVASYPAQAMPQESTERTAGGQEDRNRPPPPDFSEAAETLGITEEELHAALRASGGPPPDLAKAAESLGITEDELKAALPERPPRGRRP